MKTLIAFVIVFGSLAVANHYSDHHDLNKYWKGAPNVTSFSVQTDEGRIFNDTKFRAQIAAINGDKPLGSEDTANKALW